jgi:hypothetical protein
MTIFTSFLECPSTSKCSKIISSSGGNNYSNTGARTWSPKAEQRGIRSLNKIQRGIVKVMTQSQMGLPLNLKMFFPNDTMSVVFLQGKNVKSSGLIGVLFK